MGEIVAEKILKSIWKREIQFGDRLIEKELSEKYDVSRNAIRDAFKILEQDEMITRKPHKGTYVSEFSKKDWQELVELRSMIESYSFVEALPFINKKEFNELAHMLQEIKVKAENKNWSDLFDIDLEFHSYVVSLSNNFRIIKLYDSIQVQIRACLLSLDKFYSSCQAFYEEHRKLYEALLTRDTGVVYERIRTHIEYIEGKYFEKL